MTNGLLRRADSAMRNVAATLVRPRPVRRTILSAINRGMVTSGRVRWISVTDTFTVSVPGDHSFRYRSTKGDVIGRRLYWAGFDGFEPETTRVFIEQAQRCKHFIDIGANTAFYTLLACAVNPYSTVTAFEPVQPIFQRAIHNVGLNGWQERCRLRNEAVADRDGSITIIIPGHDLEVPSSAHISAVNTVHEDGVATESRVVRLDSVIEDHSGVDLIKLDVEGFEDVALKGMPSILASSRPTIITECNPDGPYKEIQRVLSDLSYRFFHLSESGPVEVTSIEPDESELHRNFLCIARSSD